MVKLPCDRYTVTEEDIIRGQMTNERSLRATKFLRKYPWEISMKNIQSVLDKEEVAKEQERKRGAALFKNIFYRHGLHC